MEPLHNHKSWVACLFYLLLTQSSFAQATVYTADFSGNGRRTGNNWSSVGRECDGRGSFGTSGGAFVINDFEGTGCVNGNDGANDNTLTIGPIDVSNFNCVRVTYAAQGIGSFEATGQSGADYLEIVVAADGGDVSTFVHENGGNGFGFNREVAIPPGTQDVEIFIVGGNQSIEEFYIISNISVLDYSIPQLVNNITGPCAGTIFNLNDYMPSGTPSGEWFGDPGINGSTWDATDLNPGTYDLVFEPIDPCTNPWDITVTLGGGSTAGSGSLDTCSTTGMGTFDLTQLNASIGPGNIFWSEDIERNNEITRPDRYEASNGMIVYGSYNDDGCFSAPGQVELFVNGPAEITNLPDTVNNCGEYILPDLAMDQSYLDFNVGDTITASQRVIISEGEGDCIDTAGFQVNIFPVLDIDPYMGDTTACDSLLLPAISGANLSGNQAYYTAPAGMGQRIEENSHYVFIGIDTLYVFDENDNSCSDEESFIVNIGQSAQIFVRDTVVCDTFTFLALQSTGNFEGYYLSPGGAGLRFEEGDGIKRPEGTYTIFARAGSGDCVSEASFDIRFQRAPDLSTVSSPTFCDTFLLPEISGTQLSGSETYFKDSIGGVIVQPGFLIEETTTFILLDRIGSCADTAMFTAVIIPTPSLDTIADTTVCDAIVLPPITGDDVFVAAYFTAPGGGGSIYEVGDTLRSTQSLFVYDERDKCTEEFSFELNVDTLPIFDAPLGDRIICGTFTLPNIQGPSLLGDEVFTTELGGLGDTIQAGTVFSDSAFIYLFAGVEGCLAQDSLQLLINAQPVLDTLPDTSVCDFYVLPPIVGADLTSEVAYYNQADGQGQRFRPGDTLRTSGMYYAYDETELACISQDSFFISIGLTPIFDRLGDTVGCNSFLLPPLSGTNLTNPVYSSEAFGLGAQLEEGEELLSDQRVFVYAEDIGCLDTFSFAVDIISQTDIALGFTDTNACDGFVLPAITAINPTGTEAYYTGSMGTGTEIPAGTSLSDSTVLFIFGGIGTCFDQDTLTINIKPSPIIDAISNQVVCDFYVLPAISGQNLSGTEAYYDTLTNERFLAGDTLRISRVLEARDTNNFNCTAVERWSVTITPNPVIDPLTSIVACDSTALPEIQGSFLPSSVAFFNEPSGSGDRFLPGQFIDVNQTYFAYADSLGCVDQVELTIDLSFTPQVTSAISDTLACFDLILPEIMGSNLSADIGYYSQANGTGSFLNAGTRFTNDTVIYLFGANGSCVLNDTINIQVAETDGAVSVVDSIDCNGGMGSLELDITAGLPPYQIDWNNDQFDDSSKLTNVLAGLYAVTVSDANNCSFTDSLRLSEPPDLILNCNIINQVTQPNGSDGNTHIDLRGGTLPYTVIIGGDIIDTILFNEEGTIVLDTLAAGNYTVQVADQKACIRDCDFSITAPPCALTLNPTVEDIDCNAADNGLINLNITDSRAPLSIDWNVDSLDGQEMVQGLSPGTYSVTVTDANTCIDSANFNLVEPPVLSLSGFETQPVSTNDANDGVATIQFTGGVAPYQLIWDGPMSDTLELATADSVVMDSLMQGIYIFGVLDANGCIASTTVTITNPNCGMTIDFVKTNQSCPNTNEGSLVPLITGGVAPYMLIWSDGSTDSIRSGLAPGLYELTVLDSETCVTVASDSIIIEHDLPAILDVQVDTAICEAACNLLEVEFSGTAPFTVNFQINNTLGITTDSLEADSTNAQLDICWDAVPGGDFALDFLRLDDANCQLALDTAIQFAKLQNDTNYVRETICENDTLMVNGNAYHLANAQDTMTLLGAAQTGCDSFIVVDLSFFALGRDTIRPLICQEDTFEINGNRYDFANPNGFELLPNQSANGCDSLVFVELAFFPVDTSRVVDTLCVGEFVNIGDQTFTATNPGGFAVLENAASSGCDSIVEASFTFVNQFESSMSPTICAEDSLLVNGTVYNFVNPIGVETFTSSGGCDSVVSIALDFFPIDTQFINNTLCPGDSLVVNGQTFNEANPSGIIVLPGFGLQGCNGIISVNLTYLENASTDINSMFCPTDTIIVNDVAYHFDNPSGIEKLVGQAANGCDSIVSVDMQFFAEIRTTIVDTLCADGVIVVNGNTYDVNNPSGEERLLGQGQNGCDSIVVVDLSFFEAVVASLSGDTAICAGDDAQITFNLIGGNTFDLVIMAEDGQTENLSNVSTGLVQTFRPNATFDLQIVSLANTENGCSSQDLVSQPIQVSDISVQAQVLSDFSGFGVSCADASDGRIRAVAENGVAPIQYNWSTGQNGTELNTLSAATYQVTATDAGGCIDSAIVQITAPAALNLDANSISSICPTNPNGAIVINNLTGGVGPYEYSLDGQFFQPIGSNTSIINGLDPGSYDLIIQDLNDCQLERSLTIVEEPIFIDLGDPIDLNIGDTVQLNPQSNFDLIDFSWQPVDILSGTNTTTPIASPERTSVVTLSAVDTSGCSVTGTVTIFVNQTRRAYPPSAFTPNEDGFNDQFTIFGGADMEEIEVLEIFDRWGNVLFQKLNFPPNQEQLGWDGRHNGGPVSSGAYVYRAVVRYTNGDRVALEGEVSLLR